MAPKKSIFIVVILLVIALLCLAIFFAKTNNNIAKVQIGDVNYSLELVSTDATRQQGLSEKPNLEPNTGMLFDFKQNGYWQIWMKDMNFAIDILWLNNQKQVVGVKQDALPQNYPESYGAEQQSQYVVELPAGSVNERNIKIGDTLTW
ncbi:DUF192 domain-containing protein [Candidatus Saccharibacteria bacterium]|nr:DUF192 domain-containing protein [Candidatus Saccharibacteria bacterium]